MSYRILPSLIPWLIGLTPVLLSPQADDEVARKYINEFKRTIDSNNLDERVGAIKGLKFADGERAAALLVELLDEDDLIIQTMAVEILKGFVSEEAKDYILKKGLLGKKSNARKWSAIALAYGDDPHPEAGKALLKMLIKERDPDVKVTLIRALGRLRVGEAGPDVLKLVGDKNPHIRIEAAYAVSRIRPEGAVSALAGLLHDPVWQVRVQAVDRLGRLNDPAIVPVLIQRLPKENGRLREDILSLLVKMTKEDFGIDHQRWDEWWRQRSDEFLKRYGKRSGRRYKKPQYAKGYFNISTYSKNYIFVIDLSKSMEWGIVPAESYGYGFREVPRLELAKKELVKLIEEMDEDTSFNIVHFKGTAECWQEGLVSATKKRRKEALEYVDKMNVYEGDYVDVRTGHLFTATNLYAALDMVFQWAEKSFKKRDYASAADTIFLLTDGVPMGPDWITDRDAIASVVEERNRHLKIRIHTISLTDDQHAPEFLMKLSKPNGGVFKDVLKE